MHTTLQYGNVLLRETVPVISSYGIPLAQRASYLALHSSLFGPDGTVDYDNIVTNSINSLFKLMLCNGSLVDLGDIESNIATTQ